MSLIYEIELCCNDDNGNTHQLTGMDLRYRNGEPLLTFRSHSFWMSNQDGLSIRFDGQARGGGTVTIHGKPYKFLGHRGWTGNMSWDTIEMVPEEAVRLVNDIHALPTGGWTLDEADEELAAHLESGQPLTVELLKQVACDEMEAE